MRLAVAKHEVWLDISAETLLEHQSKLEQRLAETKKGIALLQARLANKGYVSNAPAHVVEQTRSQLAEQQTVQQRLLRELEVTITK